MSDVPSERDDRLAQVLTEALETFRGGGSVDLAAWQARHPDLAGELPDLLETLLSLDTAVEDWKMIATPETQHYRAGVDTSRRDPAPTLPAQVGRYRILGRIGQGGMGTVYRAEDPQLQRVVALKIPRFEGPERLRETAIKRFLREARAAAQVRHPHVCPIHDVGEQDGIPYVVMEYVEGQSLADRLADGRRYDDPTEAVRLVRQVADALEAVHARGLVHRDLKPGNILLDDSGRCVLTDFGLARSDQDVEHLTADGALLGTPAYMAPEQASLTAGPVGPLTDIYSLGVVLYQMLTGRLPFDGPLLQVISSIAHETPPPPRRVREDLDPDLEAIILKAMARRAEERYTSAREFADALDGWGTRSPQTLAEHPPAEKPPAVERPPTVVQSTLPDGSIVTVSLQPGAAVPRNLNLTVREGRTRRKRRVVAITLSVSFALALALVIGGGIPYVVPLWKNAGPEQMALAPQRGEPAEPQPGPQTNPGVPGGSADLPHQGAVKSLEGGGTPLPLGTGNPPPPAGGVSPGVIPPPPGPEEPKVGGYPAYTPWPGRWLSPSSDVALQSRVVERVFPDASPYGVPGGAPLTQTYYNLAVSGRAPSNFPPYALAFDAPNGFGPSPRLAAYFGDRGSFGVPAGAGVTAYTNTTLYTPGYGWHYAGSPGTSGYGAGLGANPYYVYFDPYGGGLRGAAAAIAGQGQFEQDSQRTRLLNQEVERLKVTAREKVYDEWLYERANAPLLVDIQERTAKVETRAARLGVPMSEILSGYALNTVLDDLAKKSNLTLKDPYGPIDPDLLRQINVTSRSGGGNVGPLKPVKQGAALTWPVALQGAPYQDEVRRLNQRAAEAVKLAQNTGSVEPGTLNDMKDDIRRLRSKVGAHIDELAPRQAIEANRFLNQLSEAVAALAQPDVATYFPDRFAAKGRTVPELVQFMAQHGLKFAPATGGDEAAYSALYNSLLGYSVQANQSGGGR
jgi:serine/threonine protein kinase